MKTLRNTFIAYIVALLAFNYAGDDSYNCHNYAWESSRRWLDDPTPYIETAIPCNAENATHVVYYQQGKPIHSGLVIKGGWVKSKWGSNPVMIHPVYVPGSGYGKDVKFFRLPTCEARFVSYL